MHIFQDIQKFVLLSRFETVVVLLQLSFVAPGLLEGKLYEL